MLLMRYIILTSSIFYLLGLKFTSNINLNSKFETDTIKIKTELVKPKIEPQQEISTKVLPAQKNDSIVGASCGSGEMLAPNKKVENI